MPSAVLWEGSNGSPNSAPATNGGGQAASPDQASSVKGVLAQALDIFAAGAAASEFRFALRTHCAWYRCGCLA